MVNITKSKELLISTKNRLGLLLEISELLTTKNFNIKAISAHAAGNFALVGIITEENDLAMKVLAENGYSVVENCVLLLETKDRPGVVKEITSALKKLSIDIISMYGAGITNSDKGIVVFSTTDNQQAYDELHSMNSG